MLITWLKFGKNFFAYFCLYIIGFYIILLHFKCYTIKLSKNMDEYTKLKNWHNIHIRVKYNILKYYFFIYVCELNFL